MKKTYMKPATIVMNVTAQPLLQDSQGGVTTGSGLGKGYDPNAATYSRRGSSWDEDEE